MHSIRNQLLLRLIGGVLLLFAVAGAGLFTYTDEVLEHGLDAALAAKAGAIAGAVHMEDDGQPHLFSSDELTASPHHDGPFYFEIRRADGRILAQSLPPGSKKTTLEMPATPRHFMDAPLPDGSSGRMTRRTFTARPDEDEFDTTRPVTAPAAEQLTLVVAHDRRSIDQTLTVLFTGLAFTAAVVVVGIVVIVTLGVRRGLRPLSAFGGLSDLISPDSLDVRFPTADLPPELAPIGRKFNQVLDRLSAGFARERMFAAAAAHELRTPLAELRTLCEVTLRWPDDTAAATKALGEALAIATEMGGRVQSLMSLARCQAGVEKPRLEAVELGPVVEDCLGRLQSRAAEHRLTIVVKPDQAVTVIADAAMLESIVGNLLGNAVEHSPEGGRIEIGCERSGQALSLTVGNTCQSLGSEDLARMFDTFWTKSADRHGTSHAGLGLALVAAQCRVMGASVKATMPGPDWLQLRVEFTTPSTPARP